MKMVRTGVLSIWTTRWAVAKSLLEQRLATHFVSTLACLHEGFLWCCLSTGSDLSDGFSACRKKQTNVLSCLKFEVCTLLMWLVGLCLHQACEVGMSQCGETLQYLAKILENIWTLWFKRSLFVGVTGYCAPQTDRLSLTGIFINYDLCTWHSALCCEPEFQKTERMSMKQGCWG